MRTRAWLWRLWWFFGAWHACTAWAAPVIWHEAQWCVQAPRDTPCMAWHALSLPLAYKPKWPLSETIRVRLSFQLERAPDEPLGLYVPYLHHGASVRINGQLVAHLPGSTPDREVRWERPLLWQVAPVFLRSGSNELLFEVHPERRLHTVRVGKVVLDDWMVLESQRKSREFLVQGVPRLTLLMCGFIAMFLGMIWLMRPREVLYALLAATLAMWGLRTSTFLVESLSPESWLWWRCAYHWATGGFIVMLSLFASHFARSPGPRWQRWQLWAVLWWFAGPVALMVGGVAWDRFVSAYWTLGLAAIGLHGLTHFLKPLRRQGGAEAWLMSGAAMAAFLAGVHDLMMANWPQGLAWLGQDWLAQRLFLLHHAANLMLLCLAVVMTRRFVGTLRALSAMNRTLEAKVRERELALDLAFKERAQLMVAHATEEERQRIVVDMHDGLGSRLFTTLTRVERGVASTDETSLALRACIDDMRLMIDALSPGPPDLSAAFASFRHRWDENLHALQLNPRWEVSDDVLALKPGAHQVMQILQVLQEALTNVVKHAQATQVSVAAWCTPEGEAVFEVLDNGRGLSGERLAKGRGSLNMRRRAERLCGRLSVESHGRGTRVTLSMPASASASASANAQAVFATG